jgi:hypothetical protein
MTKMSTGLGSALRVSLAQFANDAPVSGPPDPESTEMTTPPTVVDTVPPPDVVEGPVEPVDPEPVAPVPTELDVDPAYVERAS